MPKALQVFGLTSKKTWILDCPYQVYPIYSCALPWICHWFAMPLMWLDSDFTLDFPWTGSGASRLVWLLVPLWGWDRRDPKPCRVALVTRRVQLQSAYSRNYMGVCAKTYYYQCQWGEHPITSYFDVHQGYKVLTQSHIGPLDEASK